MRNVKNVLEEEEYEKQLIHENQIAEKYEYKLRSRSKFKVYSEIDEADDEDLF